MLKVAVIAPGDQAAQDIKAALADIRGLFVLRTLDHYPPEPNLARFLQATAPSAIFLDTSQPDAAIALVSAMERLTPGVQIIAVGAAYDPEFLLTAMRVGIREFLTFPFDRNKLEDAVARIQQVCEARPPVIATTDKLFVFLPAKPGGGASTIAANTSLAMARLGEKVLLADFDLNLGMTSFLLKLTPAASIREAAEYSARLDESIWSSLVVTRGNLHILGSGRPAPGNDFEPIQVQQIIEFARRMYSAICVDVSGNMEPYSIELLRQSKQIYLVCTQEISSLHQARQKASLLRDLELEDRVSVLLNRSEKRGSLSMQDVEKLLGLRVRFSFPNDYRRVTDAMTAGGSVDQKSELGRQFEALARSMIQIDTVERAPASHRRFVEYFSLTPKTFGFSQERDK